jgi:hypothetical protein
MLRKNFWNPFLDKKPFLLRPFRVKKSNKGVYFPLWLNDYKAVLGNSAEGSSDSQLNVLCVYNNLQRKPTRPSWLWWRGLWLSIPNFTSHFLLLLHHTFSFNQTSLSIHNPKYLPSQCTGSAFQWALTWRLYHTENTFNFLPKCMHLLLSPTISF